MVVLLLVSQGNREDKKKTKSLKGRQPHASMTSDPISSGLGGAGGEGAFNEALKGLRA